tara:strand:- start:2152 stop:2493 length:342 start_codon:yes stop_codon:yes gene_type:complete
MTYCVKVVSKIGVFVPVGGRSILKTLKNAPVEPIWIGDYRVFKRFYCSNVELVSEVESGLYVSITLEGVVYADDLSLDSIHRHPPLIMAESKSTPPLFCLGALTNVEVTSPEI